MAAENVSFSLRRGETVALVGESGSGKSTLARLVLRLEQPDGGEILLDGADVVRRERRASLAYRRRVQMVFQDPFGSLNPIHSIAHHIERPLLRHRLCDRNALGARVLELLRTVGLEPAEDFVNRRPFELSGGQRQRVAIARALAVEPDVLVADEPTSMLDVSIRMGILELLQGLVRSGRRAILLITHDLASARLLADRILVLFRGRVVEEGPREKIIDEPKHPYTKALIASIADVGRSARDDARVRIAEADEDGDGCPFARRCPDVHDRCRHEDPAPRRTDAERHVRCHLYEEHPDGALAPRS